VGVADFCSVEVLLTAALSAGEEISRGGARAILAKMESAGLFRDSAVGGVFLLRPEVEATMLAELERTERGIERLRQQLSAAGLAQPTRGIGPELAKWALESGDSASLEAVWRTYSPGDLVADSGVRAGYAAVPTEVRAKHPGLSFAAAVASAYEPQSGRLDIDQMITALVRDGRVLHGDWAHHDTPEARVVAGTLWLLAHAVIPESVADRQHQVLTRTYDELVKLIRDSSLSGAAVTARALTFFHSIVSLVALLHGDWSRARKEGEFALILNDGCGLPAFLAALVVGLSCAVSGGTQNSVITEKFLAEHAAHGCRPGVWLEPAFHLVKADSALRALDRDQTRHFLRQHVVEASSAQWFNARRLHAAVVSTAAILWDDPEQSLARFDSLVPDPASDINRPNPWGDLLLRCRVELLLALGAWNRAEHIVVDLLARADDSVSAVPATWFYLCAGRFGEAMSKADEGIFELKISLADRAFLYAAKSAALQLGGAAEELVASAATAACVICAQANTLLPFAALPAAARNHLVAAHGRHHSDVDCFLSQAVRRGAFDALRDGPLPLVPPLRLTRREEVLLPLLATAATVQEIADQQYVSVNTLRKQVVTLRQKFDAASRDDLVRRAHEAGLLNRTAKWGLGIDNL
jgi:DNA-binding CsgD family transcriptional regulator